MDNGNANGVQRIEKRSAVVLQLSFEPATFRLEISGNCVNADVALAIMAQARRYYEGELRKAAALRMQQELRDLAADQAVAAALRKH
jgi:hypothetical protein